MGRAVLGDREIPLEACHSVVETEISRAAVVQFLVVMPTQGTLLV